MFRVVVDTNVFVSALLSADGSARAILRLALNERLQPQFSNALYVEYESLLNRKELWSRCVLSLEERYDLFDALLKQSRWVRIHYLWRPNLRDEADNHVLELAVASGVEYIITNNLRDFQQSDLLFPNIVIQTPREFLTRKGQQ